MSEMRSTKYIFSKDDLSQLVKPIEIILQEKKLIDLCIMIAGCQAGKEQGLEVYYNQLIGSNKTSVSTDKDPLGGLVYKNLMQASWKE